MGFSYKDCVDRKLLKRVPPSKEKALQSIEKAKKWLKESHKTFKSEAFNSSVLASYMGMFHSARAILFLDGCREKSHACIARYLEEKYSKTGKLERKWIDLLDHHREIRHEDQYNLSFYTTQDEAKRALASSSGFLDRMEILLKEIMRLKSD